MISIFIRRAEFQIQSGMWRQRHGEGQVKMEAETGTTVLQSRDYRPPQKQGEAAGTLP